jgi:hypothetical protein
VLSFGYKRKKWRIFNAGVLFLRKERKMYIFNIDGRMLGRGV